MIKEENYILNNGIKIPKVGYGTWQITNKEELINGVSWALKNGYTHIDTATVYRNEQYIKEALKLNNVKRENLFITSKLPANKKGYEITYSEFNESLKRLGLDYLDLYLIHAPRPWDDKSGFDFMPQNIASYKAMEELYRSGSIRAIGVSNFNVEELKELMANCTIKPMVNQIKVHIGHSNQDIVAFCQENGILVEAYSPLGTGKLFKNEKVQAVARKYNVSLAQLANRWCLQNNTLPLPKSVHEEYIKQNIDLDFVITDEDMKYLNSL